MGGSEVGEMARTDFSIVQRCGTRSGMYLKHSILAGLVWASAPVAAWAQETILGEAEDLRITRPPVELVQSGAEVEFAIACRERGTQAYFNQGVAMLHALDAKAADRAFYEAAVREPDCAMAWWGLAMANSENRVLARYYLDKAATLAARGPESERAWVAVLERYLQDGASESDRRRHAVEALSRIATEQPKNPEAAALLVRQLVSNRDAGMPVPLPAAVDALIGEVLRERPRHPIAVYRLLLWEKEQPQRVADAIEPVRRLLPGALRVQTAAGRIYTRLQKSAEAIECYKASLVLARERMATERVGPLEIPGYVENLDLLIAQLRSEGHVKDAVALARHLIELPAVARSDESADDAATAMERMAGGSAATAPFESSNAEATTVGQRHLLGALLEDQRWDELAAAAKSAYSESTRPDVQGMRIHALGMAEFARGDAAGLQAQRDALAAVFSQTRLTTTGHGGGGQREAVLGQLQALGRELEQCLKTLEAAPEADSGAKPAARRDARAGTGLAIDLAPAPAPRWALPDQHGRRIEPERNRPMLLVFYRGAGCPHCIEQLAALAPLTAEFEEAGFRVIGVSTDTVEGLRESYSAVGAKTALPFPLVADHGLATFREFGAYDLRAKKALHGLFLIDARGSIRWQSISEEPFMAVKALLAEARRTLPLWNSPPATLAHAGKSAP